MMKKKMTSARMRRVKALIATALVGVTVSVVGVMGSTAVERNYPYGGVYSTEEAYLHVYLDFLKGVYLEPDRVWCNLSLMGTRREETRFNYSLVTDVYTIESDGVLDKDTQLESYVGTSAWYGGSYALLRGTYGASSPFVKTK